MSRIFHAISAFAWAEIWLLVMLIVLYAVLKALSGKPVVGNLASMAASASTPGGAF